MTLLEMATRVGDDSNSSISISTVKARIIREINRVCSELWDGFKWSFRWRNYRIVTDVDYATGTITATNGSRTLTGSGTTFLSTHVGWHIYFPSDATLNFYKVRAYTSATQLELDVPYQGTTGSSKSYFLRHFDYVLPTEQWDFGSVVVTHDRRPISILEPMSMDIVGPVPDFNGYPTAISIFGSDSKPTTYTTGTVSGTINTQTLTGSATSWLSNIYPGDSVTIGSYTYTVYSVDTDTQITLHNNQQITSSAATYTITRQFGRFVRILWPSTNNYTLDIRALRKYAPLVNDNDTNELLYRYPDTVATKVAALELKSQNDARWKQLYDESTINISRSKAEDESLTNRDQVTAIYTYRNSRGSC